MVDTFVIRNNFYTNSANALAYLRFDLNSTADTIGGISFSDIASVTINLNVQGFNGSNTASGISIWAVNNGIASTEPGGLTETSWTTLNFTRATAPHGNTLIDGNDGVLLSDSATLSAGENQITLNLDSFKAFLNADNNDQISLALVGDSSRIPTISSLGNSSSNPQPSLTLTAIPEPSTSAMLASLLGTMALLRRRQIS
jgi:hypothetical protein